MCVLLQERKSVCVAMREEVCVCSYVEGRVCVAMKGGRVCVCLQGRVCVYYEKVSIRSVVGYTGRSGPAVLFFSWRLL